MGFLDRLFGKNADARKEEIAVLRLDGLDGWLKSRAEERDREAYRKAKPILEDIRESFDNIRQQALSIQERVVPGEIPKRAEKVIHTSKPEFVHAILEATKNVSEKQSAHDMRAYPQKTGEALASLLRAMTGPGRYLPLAYSEELEAIRIESKNIFEKKKELEGLLEGDALAEIEKCLVRLRERIAARSSLENEREQLLSETEKLKGEEAGLAEGYGKIDERRTYKDFLERKNMLEEAKAKREALETYAGNILTPLKRPLRMYRKSSQEKGVAIAGSAGSLERLIEDPIKTLASPDEKDLVGLLRNLLEAIEKDDAQISGQEKSKTLSRIRAALDADLGKLRQDLISCRNAEEELTKELDSSPVLAEKREYERRMEKNKRDTSIKQEEAGKIIKKMERTDSEIKELASSLEDAISRLEKRKICLDIRPA